MATPEYNMKHFRLGYNPNSYDGTWSTREEAAVAFCSQLEEALKDAEFKNVFIRCRPKMHEIRPFGGDEVEWLFTAKLSVHEETGESNGNT